MKQTNDNLVDFYQKYDIKASFKNLNSFKMMEEHCLMREKLFTYKLGVTKQHFKNIDLLEFGPESGENSLAFANFGANITLVEPNADSHSRIKNTFLNST